MDFTKTPGEAECADELSDLTEDDERLEDDETYQNPFNKTMSYEEARSVLRRELEKPMTARRFVRLESDYIDVLPFAVRREISEALEALENETK